MILGKDPKYDVSYERCHIRGVISGESYQRSCIRGARAKSQKPGTRQEPGARGQEPGARGQEPGDGSQEPLFISLTISYNANSQKLLVSLPAIMHPRLENTVNYCSEFRGNRL